jgi:hypothetical protein
MIVIHPRKGLKQGSDAQGSCCAVPRLAHHNPIALECGKEVTRSQDSSLGMPVWHKFAGGLRPSPEN